MVPSPEIMVFCWNTSSYLLDEKKSADKCDYSVISSIFNFNTAFVWELSPTDFKPKKLPFRSI